MGLLLVQTPTVFLLHMETEIWKPVVGYEGLYEVSSIWRVKSLKYWKERVLKWSIGKDWHSTVNLYLKGIRWYTTISRLVAIHFISNPLSLPCACHKIEVLDENWALYNWSDNLYWWTHKDNIQDMFKKWRARNHLQLNHPRKWKFWKDNPLSKKVYQYTLDWEFIREWGATREIQMELWINRWNISACCLWKLKTAGGFIWKFLID